MHVVPQPSLLVTAIDMGGVRTQFSDQLCHRYVPLPMCLWIPASSICQPGRGGYLPICTCFCPSMSSHLVTSPSHPPQIRYQLHYRGQPSENPCARLPCGPKGVVVIQGHPTQSGITKTGAQVPWSIPHPEGDQPNCCPAPTAQFHEGAPDFPCVKD